MSSPENSPNLVKIFSSKVVAAPATVEDEPEVRSFPTFPDEDPERTPERWWQRRQRQGLNLI